jgi:protein disulfide-isomerase A1
MGARVLLKFKIINDREFTTKQTTRNNMIKQLVIYSLLVALFVATAVYADGATDAEFSPEGSLVINLSEKTFDEELLKKEYAFIEFYAPWCPHCKKIVPDFEKLAKDVEADADLKDKVLIAKVDCDANQGVPGKYGVQGFPSIKLFKNGKPLKDYEGARTAEVMKSFLVKKTGASATPLESVAAVKDFVAKNRDPATQTIVVGQFKSADSTARASFLKAAELPSLENFIFAEVVSADVEKEQFTIHPYFEETSYENTDFEAIDKAVLKKGYPVVDELNGETFGRFSEAGLPIVIAFTKFSNADEKKQTIDLITAVAKSADLEGKASFTYSDGEVYGEQFKIMGGNPEKLPGIAIMNLAKRSNFPYTGEFTVEAVQEWVSGVVEGKIEPNVRSQPIPESQSEAVYTLVGKSFDEVVLDDTKDVLVEFYAPWCGHCKTLAPKYEQVAQAFADAKDKLVIAKIDSTENDTPNSGVEVQGFPTLYFFPAGSKSKPIAYEGARSVEDLIAFIKTNAVAAKDLVQNVSVPADLPAEEKEQEKDEL